MKKIIIDLDHTLSFTDDGDYQNSKPIFSTIDALRKYKEAGYYVVIFSSRNMRTFEANIGKINKVTLPIIIEWLNKHQIPHDEVIVGKPWCGINGFYVDDRAIRPSEFAKLTIEEISVLLDDEKIIIEKL
jgi:capsule biosynthesis phosphatase